VLDDMTGFQYQVGSSVEVDQSTNRVTGQVVAAIDPLYRRVTDVSELRSSTGDRIIVNKFAYHLSDPERWDVIVFKNPENPHINYIKRLIGLPGETVRIHNGDIYVRTGDDGDFQIARKPVKKQLALLQPVYDTDYPCEPLEAIGFPDRFEEFLPQEEQPTEPERTWTRADQDAKVAYASKPNGQEIGWLRYRHLLPENGSDTTYWTAAQRGLPIDGDEARRHLSQLITDFNAYNTYMSSFSGPPQRSGEWGMHWVGDLTLEATLDIASDQGTLILDLVEGGVHFQCEIDVASGQAVLSADSAEIRFDADQPIEGTTPIRGPGQYRVRYSNSDDELRLWVDDRLIQLNHPATYAPTGEVVPKWSEEDQGDLLPVGIGTSDVQLTATSLRVLRDIYYIASDSNLDGMMDYGNESHPGWNQPSLHRVLRIMRSPAEWGTTELFNSRREVLFDLEQDQFFPLGDNSAHSKDGRLWPSGERYVPRRLMIGKAIFIYYPSSTNRPFVHAPNFSRMKFIR
ncbi:MAG: signal peptidase I, partial [Pirellulaceae bacterium]